MRHLIVLVADASRARVYQVRSGVLERIDALDHPASRAKAQELVSDKPGRAFDDAGRGAAGAPQRSSMEPPTDAHTVEAQRFAREVARRVAVHARRTRAPELLLVAPPRFLGQLKRALEAGVAKRVVATVSHDYTAKTDAELVAILESLGVKAALPSPA